MNKRRIYSILAILLFVVGGVLIGKPFYDEYKAGNKQTANAQAVQKMEYQKHETKFVDASKIEQPNLAEVANASLDKKQVIGRMSIPSISLELPVLNSSTEKNLLSGATTVKEKQEMGKGNYALAGHNMSKKGVLFSDVSRLKKNDKIYLYDNENEYEYAVTGVSEVTPDKWEVVEDHGKTEVTLITCVSVLDNSKRFVVTGDFVKTKKIKG
ncbi:class A sortase [Bacillus pseudomycoides]|uniref:class A sortase n=1 Tax=Bacillus pseudomycoides TaxID=64104 RepID=UPI000BED976A|nr:class A sortase [Bacillus pseudomycoides]PED10211.1 class A sortase [Bacillus pseudomycoides]PEK28624.1 class A sortase [Bacillus pseudomycoides]PEO17723.1 class A sortase [Bacillus pseudomycoides]PEP61796.1 class A sortase [Bacillus pseudomycoides]PFW70957.1 class A sortase [Bacillus pseudomycoides]